MRRVQRGAKIFSPCLKLPPYFCQAKWPAHAQPIGPDGRCVTTGLGFIISHWLREFKVKKLRYQACCRQENAIFHLIFTQPMGSNKSQPSSCTPFGAHSM